MTCGGVFLCLLKGLNESPSKKEGKTLRRPIAENDARIASMKAPPKRRGKHEGRRVWVVWL